jgi:AraC-like DNA-binding protein
VALKDYTICRDYTVTSRIEHHIGLEFILEGGCDQQLGQRHLQNTAMPRLYVASHGVEGRQIRFHRAGESARGLGMWLAPKMLMDRFGLQPEQLAPTLQEIFAQDRDNTTTLPLTAKMRAIVEEVLTTPFTGVLREQFLQAKVTELLCHAVQSFAAPEQQLLSDNMLRKHQSNTLKKAMELVHKDEYCPPTLLQLAKLASVSRSSLTASFKASYGICLSDYIAERRLTGARRLLRSGKLTVQQVAEKVGYADQSSFGRAYKRLFKVSPKVDLPH